MELTDEQLRVLLQCDLWMLNNAPHQRNTRTELRQMGLLKHVQQDEMGDYNPSMAPVWKLTTLGHEVLGKDTVRALHMLPFHHTEHAIEVARRRFRNLSVEDLASLLTHRNKLIRAYAKERMEELTNEHN